jgi:hypothetical protein
LICWAPSYLRLAQASPEKAYLEGQEFVLHP